MSKAVLLRRISDECKRETVRDSMKKSIINTKNFVSNIYINRSKMSEKPTNTNRKSINLTNITNKFKGMLTIDLMVERKRAHSIK
jgi:phosphoenolpyruvate carboxylase